MGEITKNGLLPKKIIHQCINALLNIHKPVEYDDAHDAVGSFAPLGLTRAMRFIRLDIEVLCTLIRSSGVCIDLPEHKGHMDDYFQRIKLLSQNKSLSARIRFKLEVRAFWQRRSTRVPTLTTWPMAYLSICALAHAGLDRTPRKQLGAAPKGGRPQDPARDPQDRDRGGSTSGDRVAEHYYCTHHSTHRNRQANQGWTDQGVCINQTH